MWRDVQRIKGDPSVPMTMIVVNLFEALIIASIFYNLPGTTESFFKRGAVMFMIVSFPSDSLEDITDPFRSSSTPSEAC